MLSLVLSLSLLVAAPATKDPPKKEPPTIHGTWVAETALIGGKADPPPPGTTFTFTPEGKLMVKEGKSNEMETNDFKIDAAKKPAELDVIEQLNNKQATMKGIYKIEGDTLTMCIGLGGDRPTEFASPANSPIMLLTLKRTKP